MSPSYTRPHPNHRPTSEVPAGPRHHAVSGLQIAQMPGKSLSYRQGILFAHELVCVLA
jgi:hypothetical protein